jgi:2-oxoglutarate dehydrogenase E2 component (dihydrolipoamide succinyltransferase)
MSQAMSIRTKYKDEFEKKFGVKLGFMSTFIAASSAALKAFPLVNASIDGDDIVYKDYVDMSIAVATPTGLTVPVLRGTDLMSFDEIEAALQRVAGLARTNSLPMDEMYGGNFTITNGGVYGSMMGTPIINPPQTSILGMHNIEKRAMVVGNKIVAKPIMYLALTYDHRLIDGRDAVLFLRKIKSLVENPARMLFDI